MSDYVSRAHALREDKDTHYGCTSAVVLPFAEELGLPTMEIRALTHNLSGGARMGSTCGAVSGGVMALGLYGLEDPAVVQEYYRRFREAHDGMINCPELLKASFERGEVKKVHCDGLVYECIELAETILREHEKIE